MHRPPSPHSERVALADGPDRKPLQSNTIISDELADRQASRIARTFLLGYSMAAAIAWLAYGVAR